MTDTVSVVIPTYNRGDLIAETIRSVLAQTVAPVEVIVVDDGSTDDTRSAVAAFAPRVRYVAKQNGGVSAARNHGAELATGRWLAFTDSDDLWHPRKLEVQLAALAAARGARWSLTGCDVIDPAGRPFPGPQGWTGVFSVFDAEGMDPARFFASYLEPLPVRIGSDEFSAWHGDAWEALFLGNFGLPSSAMVEAQFFRELGGFRPDFRVAEETEFFHRAAAAAPLALIDFPLVSYRRGLGGSLISGPNATRLVENALRSLGQAATLRPAPGLRARANLEAGRRRLYEKLAWVQFTNRAGRDARRTLHAAWGAGVPRRAGTLALYLASLVPAPALGAVASLKRALRP